MNQRLRLFLVISCFCIWVGCNPSSPSQPDSNPSSNIKESIHFPEGKTYLKQKGKIFFINAQGNPIENLSSEKLAASHPDHIFSSTHQFQEGLAVAMYKKKESGIIWAYINENGKNPFGKRTFDFAGDFENGYAIVKENGRWGMIDMKGRSIIPSDKDGVAHAERPKVWIKDGETWNLFDVDKNEYVTREGFRIIGDFYKGICWVESFDPEEPSGKRAFINLNGEIQTPWYDNANNFQEGLASFEKNKKWGFINPTGSVVIPATDFYIGGFSEGMAPYAKVEREGFGKWGYIKNTGQKIIPEFYDFAADFHEGRGEVRDDKGKCGFIDREGKLRVPMFYDIVQGYSEGLAAVKKLDKWGFLDMDGGVAIDFKFDQVPAFPEDAFNGGFSGGVAKVEVEGYQFFIDKSGNCVLGCLEE